MYESEKNFIFSRNPNLFVELDMYRSTKPYHNSETTLYDILINNKDFMKWNI